MDAHTFINRLGDIDSAVRGRIPDKAAAKLLLAAVLG